MVLTLVENPRVGGSIPPQATRINSTAVRYSLKTRCPIGQAGFLLSGVVQIGPVSSGRLVGNSVGKAPHAHDHG